MKTAAGVKVPTSTSEVPTWTVTYDVYGRWLGSEVRHNGPSSVVRVYSRQIWVFMILTLEPLVNFVTLKAPKRDIANSRKNGSL